jgi:hypothetical protein
MAVLSAEMFFRETLPFALKGCTDLLYTRMASADVCTPLLMAASATN